MILVAHVVEAVNPNFLRMRALMELGKKDFRLDVISSDIVQYIVQEYGKARELLGSTPIASAATLHHNSRSSRSTIAVSFTGELPMVRELIFLATSELNCADVLCGDRIFYAS